jgi:hypothetical protein
VMKIKKFLLTINFNLHKFIEKKKIQLQLHYFQILDFFSNYTKFLVFNLLIMFQI